MKGHPSKREKKSSFVGYTLFSHGHLQRFSAHTKKLILLPLKSSILVNLRKLAFSIGKAAVTFVEFFLTIPFPPLRSQEANACVSKHLRRTADSLPCLESCCSSPTSCYFSPLSLESIAAAVSTTSPNLKPGIPQCFGQISLNTRLR